MEIPERGEPADVLGLPDRLVMVNLLRKFREPLVARAVRTRQVVVTAEPGAAPVTVFEE